MSDLAERWRPVEGADGYEVSNLGRVRSWRKVGQPAGRAPSPRILATTRPNGYVEVRLSVTGRRKGYYVHRLVMDAFVGPLPAGLETRHLDGDPENNRLDNLQYGTRSENRVDRLTHGTDFQKNKTHCPANHPYSPENTSLNKAGHRRCRECHVASHRRYLERKAAC